MRKIVRYQINMCVRTCRIQRSNPDGVFLIRRGIDDAEDGALSNKCVRQNVPDSKKQSRRRIFSYVEGLMMQKTVRYHARKKKISRLLAITVCLSF